MKKISILYWFMLLGLCSCIDDNGNYDYVELAEITIEGVPETIEVLGYVDNITIDPQITSSTEGEITANDPNYKFQYRLGYKGMGSLGGYDYENMKSIPWIDVTPESGLKLDMLAEFEPNTYICWFTITDTRNNVVTSKFVDIIVSSTTYQGWLVLCNEGDEERARLDMITEITSTRTETIHNIAKGMPEVHHATSLGFRGSNNGDHISIFSEEGSYLLNTETLESNANNEFNVNRFVFPPTDDVKIIKECIFAANTWGWYTDFCFSFDTDGNAYMIGNGQHGGIGYGQAMNTLKQGTEASFRVAPCAGFSWIRPWNSSYQKNALFYDIDNKRFMAFLGTDENQQMEPVENKEGQAASFQTNKNFVYMEGTRRSNGMVYTILEDESGTRSIYGINMSGNGFNLEEYIDAVDAPEFEQAKHFAFHSQFPLMFYATDSKLYVYNLGTKIAKELNTGLGASETITQIKFNLYRNPEYGYLNNQSEEFLNKQYDLIVASYNESATDNNGGKITFFDVNGTNDDISKLEEYTGFARIVDVVYRERTN